MSLPIHRISIARARFEQSGEAREGNQKRNKTTSCHQICEHHRRHRPRKEAKAKKGKWVFACLSSGPFLLMQQTDTNLIHQNITSSWRRWYSWTIYIWNDWGKWLCWKGICCWIIEFLIFLFWLFEERCVSGGREGCEERSCTLWERFWRYNCYLHCSLQFILILFLNLAISFTSPFFFTLFFFLFSFFFVIGP